VQIVNSLPDKKPEVEVEMISFSKRKTKENECQIFLGLNLSSKLTYGLSNLNYIYSQGLVKYLDREEYKLLNSLNEVYGKSKEQMKNEFDKSLEIGLVEYERLANMVKCPTPKDFKKSNDRFIPQFKRMKMLEYMLIGTGFSIRERLIEKGYKPSKDEGIEIETYDPANIQFIERKVKK